MQRKSFLNSSIALIAAVGQLQVGDALLHPFVNLPFDRFPHVFPGAQLTAKLGHYRVQILNRQVNRLRVFGEEDSQLRQGEDVLQRPSNVAGCFRTFRLVEPGKRQLADDRVVFEALSFLQLDERLEADGANRAPFGFHPARRGQ